MKRYAEHLVTSMAVLGVSTNNSFEVARIQFPKRPTPKQQIRLLIVATVTATVANMPTGVLQLSAHAAPRVCGKVISLVIKPSDAAAASQNPRSFSASTAHLWQFRVQLTIV